MLEHIARRRQRYCKKDPAPRYGAVIICVLTTLYFSVCAGPARAEDFQVTTGTSYVSVDAYGHGRCTIPLTYIPGSVRGVAARRGDRYHVWFASGAPGHVFAANSNGQMTGFFPVVSAAGDPTDIAMEINTIWICTDGAMVCEYSLDGLLLRSFPATAGVTPTGIALMPASSTIWVLDEAGVLSEYTKDGVYCRSYSFASTCVAPCGLDMDWYTGDFWLADEGQNCICLFDSLSQPLQVINVTGCTGLTGVCCGDMYDPCLSTAAELDHFGALCYGDRIEIEWETVAESDNAGFNLYRSRQDDGERSKINVGIIPSRGEELLGARYLFCDEGILNDCMCWYWLESVDVHGAGAFHDPVLAVAAGEELPLPADFVLNQNHPNPFNPGTVIEYHLAADCHVVLAVFGVAGSRIITLVDEYQDGGNKVVSWDGMDCNGSPVPSGAYFYRLTAGNRTETRKMIVVR